MYTAMVEVTSCDTSYDIWKNAGVVSEGYGGEYKNFSDAKKYVLDRIDAEIDFLRRKRAEIRSMKKYDVFEPGEKK